MGASRGFERPGGGARPARIRDRTVPLVHPPWFDDETNDLGAVYFQTQGFDAVATRADTLPDDPAQVRPGPVTDWVSHHLADHIEAVFLGGNGFHAVEAVEQIERRTGRLVLSANQVLLWSILAATRLPIEITAYGRLLRDGLPTPDPASAKDAVPDVRDGR